MNMTTPEDEARVERLVEAHPLVVGLRDQLAHARTMVRRIVLEQMTQAELEENQVAAKDALERAQAETDKLISDRKRWAQKVVRQCDRLLGDSSDDD